MMFSGQMFEERVSRGGLREQVSERILRAVFEGRFLSGQHLVVQNLAEMYGVSQTPVRESLVELSGLGIVELLPNRGAVVRPFGPQQLREMMEVRRVLEAEAARIACGCLRLEDLQAIKGQFMRLSGTAGAGWDESARRLDTQLHSLIRTACGNTRLAAEIERYLFMGRILRDLAHARDASTNYQRTNDVPEHVRIVDALLANAPEEAQAAMEAHLRSAAAALEEVLFGEERKEAANGEAAVAQG